MAIKIGTNQDDEIAGTDRGDIIIARAGDDLIDAGAGNDLIDAGKGDDTVDGGSGNDFILAGSGNDTVTGGAGNDYVNTGAGDDVAIYLVADNEGSHDVYDGSSGSDTLRLVFTSEEWLREDVQADIANFLDSLSDVDHGWWGPFRLWCGFGQNSFNFEAFGLTAKNFESLEVVVDDVLINPFDEPVDAADDQFEINEDGTITASVLANDSIPDLVKSIELVEDVSLGQLILNADGTFIYDTAGAFEHLAEGETATQTFTYQVADADGDTDTATATITIHGANNTPVAVADFGETDENTSALFDVLSNDTDVDHDDNASNFILASVDSVTVTGIAAAALTTGSVSISDNKISFDPGADFDELDEGEAATVTIAYTMTDDSGASSSSQLTVTVIGNDDASTSPLLDLDVFIANYSDDGEGLNSPLGSAPNQILINDGGGAFSTPTASQPPGSDGSTAVALGDLDGDGDLDAFVANFLPVQSAPNQVLYNLGSGTFSAPPLLQPTGQGDSFDVALGDLDGDGDLDAFVANVEFPNLIQFNDGGAQGGIEGTFLSTAFAPILPGVRTLGVALGDLDGDGDLDAFEANSGANRVLVNDATGTFSTPALLQPPGSDLSWDVALGDLDGDGDLDAFVANQGANQVLINDGSGIFTAPALLQPPGSDDSRGLALGDLDGDGDFDAFVANLGTNQVLINDGSGTFTAAMVQPPGSDDSWDVALGDLDGDGDLDAVVANLGVNQVLINDGSGTFTAPPLLQPTGSSDSFAVALGDLDGGGTLPAVDQDGLPNIDPLGLLPDMYVDIIA